MKHLITTLTGGFPLTLDRIRWMDEGNKEALKAICRALLPAGATSMILEGCDITTEFAWHYNVSAGWIFLKTDSIEEICQVDAHSYVNSGGTGTARWVDYEVYDASGSVIFFSGAAKEVHKIVKADIRIESDTTYPAVTAVPRLSGTWVRPTIVSTYTHNLYYKLNKFGLCIKGTIQGPNGALFTLPVGARPTVTTRLALTHAPVSSLVEIGHLVIATSGQVSLEVNDAGPDYNTYYINTIINID